MIRGSSATGKTSSEEPTQSSTSAAAASADARASTLATGADLLLCVGSSLEVFPVAGLPQLTLAAGGAVAIVTRSETSYDERAAVRLGGDVEAELEGVLAAL